MRTLAALLLPLLSLTTPAQDEPLGIERAEDSRAHAAAVRLLSKTRVRCTIVDASPRELCGLFASATGDALAFACRTDDFAADTKVTLELQTNSLLSVMAIVQQQTGLRFVFRNGVVFLTTAAKFKPLTHLAVYDLRAACMKLRHFPGPDLRLRLEHDDRPLFPEPIESDDTVSGFTAEQLETLLRDTVAKDSWDRDDVTLINQNGLFLIRQTPAAHRQIERTLAQLGVWSPRRVAAPPPVSRPAARPSSRPRSRR